MVLEDWRIVEDLFRRLNPMRDRRDVRSRKLKVEIGLGFGRPFADDIRVISESGFTDELDCIRVRTSRLQ
jgi:hypothetical protein